MCRPLQRLIAQAQTNLSSITSPQAFYVYSTVKIVNVRAVTQNDGQQACATVFTYTSGDIASVYGSSFPSTIFSGINSYAETYYGYLDFGGYNMVEMPLSTQTVEITSYSFEGTSLAPIDTGSITIEGSLITSLPIPTGVTVSFSTPFIYLPSGTKSVGGGLNENDNISYGYVPKDLINWMVQNADYVR